MNRYRIKFIFSKSLITSTIFIILFTSTTYSNAQNTNDLLIKLKDSNCYIRGNAAKSLGETRDPQFTPYLIETLNDRDSYVQRWSAHSLGEIGDQRAVEPLIKVLTKKSFDAKGTAAEALGKLNDPRAVKPLISVLQDPKTEGNVEEAIAKALAKIGDPVAIDPIIKAMSNTTLTPGAYTYSLAKFGKTAVEPLIKALQNKDRLIRERSADTLAEIGDPQPIDYLIAAIDDDYISVKKAVVWALADLSVADPKAIEPLKRCLNEKDPYIKKGAARALASIQSKEIDHIFERAKKNKDFIIVAGGYMYFIIKGESETETLLIESLNSGYGDKEMAQGLINCGNHKLKDAALDWVNKNNYRIMPTFSPESSPKWGKK